MVKQLHLADSGNATAAAPEPALVFACLGGCGGDPFANEPGFRGLSSNLY